MGDDPLKRTCDELDRSWDVAVQNQDVVVRSIEIAGLHLRLEGAGSALIDTMWSALAHHPTSTERPDLTLRLWDLESTGAPRPPIPTGMVDNTDNLLHHLLADETTRIRFDPANQSLTAWDLASATAWYCAASSAEITWWEQAAPLRHLFGWWLERHDRLMVHGAAVGDGDGALVLGGPGGSGKSTTALAALFGGLGYLADDYCVVSLHPCPRVHSLYGTAKLRLDDHDERGPLAGHLLRSTARPGEKAVALVSALPGGPMVESAPIRSVLAVRIGRSEETRVRRAPPARVLAAIAPSSILQLHGTGASSFAGLARLVREVPVGVLELGTDRRQVLDTVIRLARSGIAT